MIMSQSQILGLAQEVGLTGNSAITASAIAMAESRGDTNAIGPVGEIGLWQIYPAAHPQYNPVLLKDPLQNAAAMYSISNGGTNWKAWTTYSSGAYKQYMSSSIKPVQYTGVGSITPVGSSPTPTSTLSSLSSTVKTNPVVLTDQGSAFTWILAYTVAGLIFVFVSKFEAGYNALYYMAVLVLLMLVLTQARFIASAIAPITEAQQLPNDVPSSSTTQGVVSL